MKEADGVERYRLGTSRGQAGTPENFEKIDREYVLNAAKAAKLDDSHPQRLVYVSVSLHGLVTLLRFDRQSVVSLGHDIQPCIWELVSEVRHIIVISLWICTQPGLWHVGARA